MPAINPHKSDVEFEADGKAWVVRLDIKTIRVVEKALGKAFAEISRDESLDTLCELMRAALQTYHPDVTADRAVELIEDVGTTRASQAIAMSAALAVSPGGMAGRTGPLKLPELEPEAETTGGTGSASTTTGANMSTRRQRRSGTKPPA